MRLRSGICLRHYAALIYARQIVIILANDSDGHNLFSMNDETINSIVICGPTACGKTRLAVSAALRIGGEIISADSRQVYRGMDIGTGKDLSEYHTTAGDVPYHCIDIASPEEVYTLFRYIIDFNRAFNNIRSRGKIPVIAGGTGLYIEAAVKQYDVSEVPEDKEFRDSLMVEDSGSLAERLEKISPDLYSRTDLTSKKRIVRALEIARAGSSGSVSAHAEKIEVRPVIAAISYPRETVIRRIDERLESRLSEGMIDEVRRLIDSGIGRERLMMLGMEYSCVGRHLLGEWSYDAMVEELRNEIHRLAKRQMTWFRGMERRGLIVNWIEDNHEKRLQELFRSHGFEI
jgi:tRNA dimethylallyltransferase